MSRRRLLGAGASLPLASLAACMRQPDEQIVPYVDMPEHVVPGRPRYYATSLTHAGTALGVLVESHTGRPTKVEGNPEHPASLGATDVYAQAAVTGLYDEDRSRSVLRGGAIVTFGELERELAAKRAMFAERRGEGLRVLSEAVFSPTLERVRAALLDELPLAVWHEHEPVHRDAAYAGAELAFGEAVDVVYRFERAAAVLSLDADFLGAGPGHLHYARRFAERRRPGAAMSRLYALESAPTQTGAMADHGRPLRVSDVERAARRLARRLGIDVPPDDAASALPAGWLEAAAAELERHRGASIVVAGEHLSAETHALVHAINERLGNVGATVEHIAPVAPTATAQQASLERLVDAMAGGAVDTLLVLGANPVYCAPADVAFAERLGAVDLSVHLGLYDDETGAACDWHVPAAHALESWGDARAFDGTAGIVQPLIAPLYGGMTAAALAAVMLDAPAASPYEQVRETWRAGRDAGAFEDFWRAALTAGYVAGSRFEHRARAVRMVRIRELPAPPPARAVEVRVRPDPTVWDGRFANDARLQELPKPIVGLVWGNAALVSPRTARRLGVDNGDELTVGAGGRRLAAPAWITPGHADESLTLTLGYGRRRAGHVGNGLGYDAYAWRTSARPWHETGVEVRAGGRRVDLVAVQQHDRMEGREPVRTIGAAALARGDTVGHAESPRSLYPRFLYDGHAWGMSIDLNACIGCRACTIACDAENNVPVVGKDEVARGREMHWMRVDRYYAGPLESPRTLFQPVPCMHCEKAPCEYVCPVHATVHDHEGLNVQVYNRCIGTRDCSQNCPYKVRRFNWADYNNYEGDTNAFAIPAAAQNPAVTVRSRGVMEKCTYCIQRISRARVAAKTEGRPIADGDIVTACQAVCPTEAIVFGDVNDPDTRVSAEKRDPRDYALLAELNTRPRTSYLARVLNPNPALAPDGGDER